MKASKNKIILTVLLFFAVAILAFIFFQGSRDGQTSQGISGSIVSLFLPDGASEADYLRVNNIVRKTAHFLEYAALGFFVMLISIFVKKQYKGVYLYGFSCFAILFIAVLDEYIQGFVGRTSSTADVLLDLSGGLFGMAFAALIYLLARKFIKFKK